MMASIWHSAGFWSHITAAFVCTAVAIWLWQKGHRQGARPVMLVAALAMTAVWAVAVSARGDAPLLSSLLETARNFAWLLFLYSIWRPATRGVRQGPVLAIYTILVLTLACHLVLDVAAASGGDGSIPDDLTFYGATGLRMLFAIGALVLVHNLYTLSPRSSQAVLRLHLTALAVLLGYDLNLYTVAYLAGQVSPELAALRGCFVAAAVPFFAFASARASSARISSSRASSLRLNLSRSAAFQSFSLIIIGTYLAFMIGASRALAFIGGDYARLAQVSFIFVMSAGALMFLPSGKYRAWFKVKIAKHFFQHRYDYRSEWMRFTDTIGRPGDDAAPFHERVIQAVADISEAASGLLLTPDENGLLRLQARWNWPTIDVPAIACKPATISYFEDTGDIVELAKVRSGEDSRCDRSAIPEWLLAEHSAWALVPLVHSGRLAGIVVLSRPPFTRTLDWEDYDMLRVVGCQVASYLAEEKGQESLLQARQFEEFNRRFAFVLHDIKNIVSQLSLVARNAERHADNPEFRADMVDTLQGSVTRMNALLARLSRYGNLPEEQAMPVNIANIARTVATEKSGQHPVQSYNLASIVVMAHAANLQQVISHLVQNAIDASPAGSPVFIKCYASGLSGCIEIFDSGTGMTPDFVRSQLFRPFVSSKTDGFGIGAYEARTLVQAMHGRIDVESRVNTGSRFTIRLPLAKLMPDTASPHGEPHNEPGNEPDNEPNNEKAA